MSEIDIQDLNLKQLAELRDRIDIRATEIEQEEKDRFVEMMKQEASERGLDLEEVFGTKLKIPRKKAPPKYENPDFNPETDKPKERYWTGHGRKPAWAVAFIEKNGNLDGCLINKAEEAQSEKPSVKASKKKPAKKSK